MRFLIILPLIITCPVAMATDFTTSVRSGSSAPEFENGGYAEIGGLVGYVESAIVSCDCEELSNGFVGEEYVNGEYRFNRFFAEASYGTLDGVNIGATLFNGIRWEVDFLAASAFGYINDIDNSVDLSALSESEKNKRIEQRQTFFNGAGFRLTYYSEKYITQFRIVKDTHGGNGVLADLKLGSSWQVKNWNFHSIGNINWGSESFANYWFGVEENIATDKYAAYKAKSGLVYIAEIGVTYPMTENWVFKSTYRYAQFSKGLNNSPLMEGSYNSEIFSSIGYVF